MNAAVLLLLAQTPKTLDPFLKSQPIPFALAVSAEQTRAGKGAASFETYGRKAVKLGSVTAIVPFENVQFDDSLRQAPNLYDGLPRDAKVLYLMSTLSPSQWKEASGPGMGIRGLSPDQRSVFTSILPKRLAWTKYKINKDGYADDKLAEGTLDEKAVGGVRLRLERQLQLNTFLVDKENSYTFHSPTEDAGKPGDVVYQRDRSETFEAKDAFGVEIRRTVPNVPKKGQLDTSVLNVAVAIPAKTSVRDALARIGSATRREILVDLRVADRTVTFGGDKARAGDLLDALALAVGGTYRRVGTAYELVFDVTGFGTRKLKHALWQDALRLDTARREQEWRKAAMASGGVANVDFESDGALNPGPALRKRLERNPIGKVAETPYSTDELTPELRSFIDRINARTTTQKVRTDKVLASSRLIYRFVLPDGNPLPQEGYLGESYLFVPGPLSISEQPFPVTPKVRLAKGSGKPLAVHAETLVEARQALAAAQAFGFEELWIETNRPEVLAAATTSGSISVRLIIRPWNVALGDDRNILGETGVSVAKRQLTDPLWQQLLSSSRRQTYPPSRLNAAEGNAISPLDPRWPARRNALVALAQSPGLAGIVVNDSLSHGYESKDNGSQYGGYSRNLVESWALGYDEPTRLAFLRA